MPLASRAYRVRRQATQPAKLTGRRRPAKTVALTFDDGPGSRTLELSAFR